MAPCEGTVPLEQAAFFRDYSPDGKPGRWEVDQVDALDTGTQGLGQPAAHTKPRDSHLA